MTKKEINSKISELVNLVPEPDFEGAKEWLIDVSKNATVVLLPHYPNSVFYVSSTNGEYLFEHSSGAHRSLETPANNQLFYNKEYIGDYLNKEYSIADVATLVNQVFISVFSLVISKVRHMAWNHIYYDRVAEDLKIQFYHNKRKESNNNQPPFFPSQNLPNFSKGQNQ